MKTEDYQEKISRELESINRRQPEAKIAIGEKVWFHINDIIMPIYKGSMIEEKYPSVDGYKIGQIVDFFFIGELWVIVGKNYKERNVYIGYIHTDYFLMDIADIRTFGMLEKILICTCGDSHQESERYTCPRCHFVDSNSPDIVLAPVPEKIDSNLRVFTEASKQTIVLGTNRTGKTTFLENMVTQELKKKDRRVLVVVPDNLNWSTLENIQPESIGCYEGARKIIYCPGLMKIIVDQFRDGLVIFEDCRAYLSLRPNKYMFLFFIRRRQNNIDTVFVGHGFSELASRIFTFTTHYVIFKTLDNIVRRKDVILNFSGMKAVQIRVNARAVTEPHHYEELTF